MPNDYELTLKFKISSEEEIDKNELAKMLGYMLEYWHDGRHRFHAEMIHEGLARCLEYAVYEAICAEMQEKYGHEVVPHSMTIITTNQNVTSNDRGHTSKWHIEAEKAFKKRQKASLFSDVKVEIT